MFIFPTFRLRVERWKFNKDYGVFVSTLGNFKNRHKRNLPIKIDAKGYCRVKTENGTPYAHRLVLFTWRPIPDAENLTVDHLNHNKRDNSLDNLEWVTMEENWRRAREDLLHYTPKKNKKAVFTLDQDVFEKCIEGYDVNGVICKEEEVHAEVNKYYNNSYPKESVEKIIKALKSGKCPTGSKKVGKKGIVTIKIIFKKGINE